MLLLSIKLCVTNITLLRRCEECLGTVLESTVEGEGDSDECKPWSMIHIHEIKRSIVRWRPLQTLYELSYSLDIEAALTNLKERWISEFHVCMEKHRMFGALKAIVHLTLLKKKIGNVTEKIKVSIFLIPQLFSHFFSNPREMVIH